MHGKAKLLGHPIHQMLIVFPLGLLATALIFDLFTIFTGRGVWSAVAFFMIGAGILGGLLAAVFGLWDWMTIPANTRAKALGAWHGLGNLLVVLFFAGSWLLRWNDPAVPSQLAFTLSFAGGLLSVVTGWMGGELVDRLGVGVDEGANVNAPSSLSTDSVSSHDDRPKAA